MSRNSRSKPISSLLQPVAGNGLMDRRLLLQRGLVLASAVMAADVRADSPAGGARPRWMREPGAGFTPYGEPSPYERRVARYASPNRVQRNDGASWTPLHLMEGSITPNGLHFVRDHNGTPAIDPEKHRMLVHGLVRRPLFYTVQALLQYPLRSQICFIECAGNSNAGWNRIPSRAEAGYFNGLVSGSEWTGIPLGTILREAGVKQSAKWLIAEGADAFAMDVSIPLEKAYDDVIIALYQNGERLRPENGYPLRLVVPGWEGVRNVKWLRRLQVSEKPAMARNETARYTELLADGKALRFDFVMEAKSLITSPSSGMVLAHGPGLYQITGLAWSGHGRIRRVDVSTDGGRSWAEAALQEPVLPKALTRFRIPWRWNGKPAHLQSRAVDETGYVQPTRKELIAKKGLNGFYHYNAIITWAVDGDGLLSHIYEDQNRHYGSHPAVDAGWD